MSLEKCLNDALSAGALTEEQVNAIKVDAKVAIAELRAKGVHSEEQAKILGEQQALEFRQAVAKRNKYHKVLQNRAIQKNTSDIMSHDRGAGAGLMSKLVKDRKVDEGQTPWSNIDNRASAIEGQAHAQAKDMLQHLHTTHFGMKQDSKTMTDTVREIFGEDTGNPKAKAAAAGWSKAAEYLRERFNRAGGFIPKRNDWGLPQVHKQERVAKASREEWIQFVMPLLKRDAILNYEGRVMTDAELVEALGEAYSTISTGGLNKKKVGQFSGAGKMANRHQESRWLVFDGAEAWVKYQNQFGEVDTYNILTGHLRNMSSEIAMLEVLGPNPEHAYRHLKDVAEMNDPNYNQSFVDAVWDVVSGTSDAIANNREAAAKWMGASRHLLMAAQLGSAVLSAISDPVFGRLTRKFNGLPAMRMVQSISGQLNPANEADRAFAAHMGLVAEGWTQQVLSGARFGGEADPSGAASKVSEFVFRSSGLSAWTHGQRNAFGLDVLWHMGRQMEKPLAELDDKFQDFMRRYGVTDEDWEIMRAAKREEYGGTTYFRPQNMYDLGLPVEQVEGVVTKVLEAINTEMDFAVPSPDARVRAVTTAGYQRGTAGGELMRSLMMYKSFSIVQMMTHLQRGSTFYKVALGLQLTALGALALQMKEVAKGREPRDMTDSSFFMAAALQGGGAGIFGDFVGNVAGSNRYGNDFIATAAGPYGGFVQDMARLVGSGIGAATDPFTGEDTNFGREAVRMAKKYTPANSLWHSRLILERAIWDNLEELTDERAPKNWKKYERKLKTERDQDYWWRRGEAVPTF